MPLTPTGSGIKGGSLPYSCTTQGALIAASMVRVVPSIPTYVPFPIGGIKRIGYTTELL